MEIRTRTLQSFGLNICLAFLGVLLFVYGYIAIKNRDDVIKAVMMWLLSAALIFCPWFVGSKERKVWYCHKCRYFLEVES